MRAATIQSAEPEYAAPAMNPRVLRPLVLALAVACGGATTQKQEAVSLPQQSAHGAPSNQAVLAQPGEKSEADAAVPIVDSDPVWGSRTAPVTIVEFSDFQCPFCGRAFATIKQLEEAYGEPKLRVVFKHAPLPFHPNAKPAAEAAVAVRALGGDRAFWKFHDLLFQNQADLGPAKYEAWAQ